MALSESNILKICQVLKINSIDLNDHLDFYATYFTTERNTQITTELDSWDLVKGDFVKVHPVERNYGVEINSNNAKDDVRSNLESLLMLSRATWYQGSGFGQVTFERG